MCWSYQVFNDFLDSSNHQDKEQRHQRGPPTSGRNIWDLLRDQIKKKKRLDPGVKAGHTEKLASHKWTAVVNFSHLTCHNNYFIELLYNVLMRKGQYYQWGFWFSFNVCLADMSVVLLVLLTSEKKYLP